MRQSQTVAGQSNSGELVAMDRSVARTWLIVIILGGIHIQRQDVQVRIEGSADPVLLRVLLECLRA
jgi:hypothetical protein